SSSLPSACLRASAMTTFGAPTVVFRLSTLPGCRRGARAGALEEQVALARVARQLGGALELHACLVRPANLDEQIAPHAWEKVIPLKQRFPRDLVDQIEAGLRTVRHAERHGTIQIHDW